MKKQRALVHAIICSAILLITLQLLAQAEISQSDWDAQQARNQLLDQEKYLLQEHDNLQKDIDELKQQVDARLRRISAAQTRLDKIRHDLITVKMKLLP